MTPEPLTSIDAPGWLSLRAELWPDSTPAQHREEMASFLADPGRFAQFVVRSPEHDALGFVEASLRTEHVTGAGSLPVAFLEGLYVRPAARRNGLARRLVQSVIEWAASQGCTELASDTPLENLLSQSVHRQLGFQETQRIVYFSMPVPPLNATADADREFFHARLVDAPPEQVFRAFSDPGRLARWWGPDGFSSTFETFDLRPGGDWRFVLHGPDGTDYPNENVFRELEPPSRVVVEHISDVHHFRLTITFEARGHQTLVGWRQRFDSAEHRQSLAAVVPQANEQNLSRLQAEVARVRP